MLLEILQRYKYTFSKTKNDANSRQFESKIRKTKFLSHCLNAACYISIKSANKTRVLINESHLTILPILDGAREF